MTSVLSDLTGMVTNGPTMPSLIENFVAAAKNPSKEHLVGFDGCFEAQHTTHGKAAGNTVLLQVTGLRYPGDTPSRKVFVRGNVVGKKSRGVLCQAVVEYDLATRTGVIRKV